MIHCWSLPACRSPSRPCCCPGSASTARSSPRAGYRHCKRAIPVAKTATFIKRGCSCRITALASCTSKACIKQPSFGTAPANPAHCLFCHKQPGSHARNRSAGLGPRERLRKWSQSRRFCPSPRRRKKCRKGGKAPFTRYFSFLYTTLRLCGGAGGIITRTKKLRFPALSRVITNVYHPRSPVASEGPSAEVAAAIENSNG